MNDLTQQQQEFLAETNSEATCTSIQQRGNESQDLSNQVELGIASTDVYLEHGCFEMPVLEASSLLVAQHEGRAPFAPDSPLHLALVAAAIPWLESHILEFCGYSSRVEALDKTIVAFERTLQLSVDMSGVEKAQALLLILHSSNQASIKQQQSREASWLQQAISELRDAFSISKTNNDHDDQKYIDETEKRSQKRLLRRLWWCALIAEQSYFLRYSLEASKPSSLPAAFALDPRTRKPLEISDMDLARFVTPFGHMSADWSRLERAACFVEKARLFSQLACTLLTRPKLQVCAQPPKYTRTGYICHNEQFWIVQTMEDQFLRYLNDNRPEDGPFPNEESYLHQQTELILIFCRILIALCLPSQQSVEPNRWIWQQLRYESVTRSICKILNIGRMASSEARQIGLFYSRTSSLLRALTVSIRAATSKAHDLSIGSKQHEMLPILNTCLEENESFWSGPLTDMDYRQDTPALAESTVTSTPAPDCPDTPGDVLMEDPLDLLEKSACEHFTGQEDLITRFDYMWNDEMYRYFVP